MDKPRRRGGRGERGESLNALTEEIIGAAIAVHRELGPGLLESAYETCLAYELDRCGHRAERQLACPVRYKGILLDSGFRIDLLVASQVVVELKTVEALNGLHEAQILTYLQLTGCCVGLLINFHTQGLRDGIRRRVFHFPDG